MKNSRREREKERKSVWVPENLFHPRRSSLRLFFPWWVSGGRDAAWTERKGGRWKIDENGGRSSNNGGSNELFTVHGACIVAHKYFPGVWVSLDIKIFYVAARIHDADAPAYKHYAYRSAHVHVAYCRGRLYKAYVTSRSS